MLELDISVDYRSQRHDMVVRRATFDEQGNLISDDLTQWGRVLVKADSYADQVGPGSSCHVDLTRGLDGFSFISHLSVTGGSPQNKRVRAELWFNEKGYAYRGIKYDAAGKIVGGFEDPGAYPDQGMSAGELATVETPRFVTLACEACRSLADDRNTAAEAAAPLAQELNRLASEHNIQLAAREKVLRDELASGDAGRRYKAQETLFTAGVPYRERYAVMKVQYDAAMAALNAAHATYLACEESQCRKPEPAEDGDRGFEVSLGVGYAWQRLPALAFLGDEPVGATQPRLGLFASERSFDFARYALDVSSEEMEWELGNGMTVKVGANLRHGEGTSRAEYERTDLGGNRLVIPGLGQGPNGNGFVFSYFAGLNTPENVEIVRDFVTTAVALDVNFAEMTPSERTRLVYGFSLSYEAQDHAADFSASVPGFARDIAYAQEIDADLWRLGLQVGLEWDIDTDWTLGLKAEGGLVFADLDGTNRLEFTAFAPQFAEDETTKKGWDADFTAYLEGAVGEKTSIVIAAEAFYSSGTTPVWETPGGGEPARIETDDRSGYFFGTWLRFQN